MGREPRLPSRLLKGVFSVEEARRCGLERWHLEGASWTRVGPSLYVRNELDVDPIHRLEAARRRLPETAAFSGLTAAWLHGLDVSPCDPIEVTVPDGAGVSNRSGLAVRRSAFAVRDVVTVRGMRATAMFRTVGDLCGRIALTEAVAIADAALHAGCLRLDHLLSWADEHSGRRGLRDLRRLMDLVDGATESPMESRLRVILVQGGLPKPKSQVTVRDRWGRALGRPDLYYEDQRLGIEYDGGTHRDSLVEDNRRQNRLLNAGVRLLRFTAADLRNPTFVVSQVRQMLTSSSAGIRGFESGLNAASAGGRG